LTAAKKKKHAFSELKKDQIKSRRKMKKDINVREI
jgi:hypothetical protein